MKIPAFLLEKCVVYNKSMSEKIVQICSEKKDEDFMMQGMMKKERKRGSSVLEVDLLHGNILKSLLIFAIPLMISQAFQQFYNAVDTMIVGNYLGDRSLAAIGSCASIYELLVGFSLGIGNGLSIVAARSYGAGNEDQLKRAVTGSVVIGVGVTTVLAIISQTFLHPLLVLLGTPETILEEAYSYISLITLFVGIMFAYNLFAGLLRAIGNSVMPLVFLIISSILNVILDIVFITRFQMGIRGAAVATVIAQGISAVLCLLYIWKCCPILIPERKHWKVGTKLYKELLGQGFSMGLMSGIVSLGSVILQAGINNFGYLIIAGHTSARKIHSFCCMPIVTLGMALATFISQNRGAGQKERIRKGVRYANLLSLAWGTILTIFLYLAADVLVRFLSGSSELEVLENGARYLRINGPFYMVLGILLNMRNALQGLGSKLVPLISSGIELIGKVLFVLLIIPGMGYLGVIICEPVIWCFMCAQLLWSFYRHPFMRKE